jgi:hypothetical protein
MSASHVTFYFLSVVFCAKKQGTGWHNQKNTPPPPTLGASLPPPPSGPVFPWESRPAAGCCTQLGLVGWWYERVSFTMLWSDRMERTTCLAFVEVSAITTLGWLQAQ